jgi:hypothetical protein
MVQSEQTRHPNPPPAGGKTQTIFYRRRVDLKIIKRDEIMQNQIIRNMLLDTIFGFTMTSEPTHN